MKILHVINSLNIGGAETLLVNISLLMKKENHDITVFVLGGAETFLTQRLVDGGVKVINVTPNIRSFKNIVWLFENIKDYDTVHSHLSWAQYYTAFVSFFYKNIKLFTTEHSTSNRRQQNKFFRQIDCIMYREYSNIIAISDGTREALCHWQPKYYSKIKVIENGIDLNKYQNVLADSYIQARKKIKLLMVAGFREEKDQDTLVRALSLLDNKYELFLVGDGPRKKIVEALAEELYVNDRVHFLGIRSDVPNIMKACDIFILSSHWEGFGLVVVEAMAIGLPVIGSNVAGLVDVIGDNGLVFEKGNEKDLAQKILDIEIGKSLKEINLEKYSLQKTVDNYLNLYIGEKL